MLNFVKYKVWWTKRNYILRFKVFGRAEMVVARKSELISLRGYNRHLFSESAILNDITSPALMQRLCHW